MEKLKRISAFLIASIVFITQIFNTLSVYADNTTESNYLAIEANSTNINASKINIDGKRKESNSISDLKQGILYLLTDNTQEYDNFNFGNTEYSNENPLYSYNSIAINANQTTLNNVIVSEKDINISCTNLTSSEFIILYSCSGNITINVNKAEFNGIIYAPKGIVTINASDVKLTGSIIADKINIGANNLSITPNEFSEQMYEFLYTLRNDSYMEMDAYIDENDLYVESRCTDELTSMDIYVRYDNDNEFKMIGTIKGNEGYIEDVSFNDYLDIIAVGKLRYNTISESNLVTLTYDEEGELIATNRDSDEDGIEDGIEIFYLKTDPYSKDTDNDGVDDGIEVFYLKTDPLTITADEDFDNDGISNLEEIKNGTNPYLKDSDFDGYDDKVDTAPLQYNKNANTDIDYTEKLVLGRFDKVITVSDSEGRLNQYIYNFISKDVLLETSNNMVTTYHYNLDRKVTASIQYYNGEYLANMYTYQDELITSVSNSNYIYQFKYDDNYVLTDVFLNDICLESYYSEDEIDTTSLGNDTVLSKTKSNDTTVMNINGIDKYKISFDADSKTRTYENLDNGFVYNIVYDNNNKMVSLYTNTDFVIDYLEDEDETKISYTFGDITFSQINKAYFDESENYIVSTELISGAQLELFEKSEDIVVQRLITDNNVFDTEYNYLDSIVESIKYSNEETIKYSYNELGDISEIFENNIKSVSYTYDDLRRIIVEKNHKNNVFIEYSYDKYNNITYKRIYSFENDTKGELISENSYDYQDEWGDLLTSFNNERIEYDQIGNPLSYINGKSLEWEGKQLSGVKESNQEVKYTYNDEGFRISKTINGITTWYNIEGQDIISEITGDEVVWYIYDNYATILGFIYSDNTYYYVKNATNDVIGINDENGESLCKYSYDAWGNVLNISGDIELGSRNPFRYRSYYYDEESGFYHLRSRYYDSTTGRFINADSSEMLVYSNNNYNLFAYCYNNPVNFDDASGRAATKIYVMSLPEWEVAAKNIADNFMVYFRGNTPTTYLISNNMNEYESKWNAMSGYDIVVFNTHGSPIGLYNEVEANSIKDSDVLTIDEIKKLKYKSLKLLLIIGCNAGHWNYIWENVAWAFSTRISGYVVASDGTVLISGISFYSNQTASFESTQIDPFYSWCNLKAKSTPRKNYGWVVYRVLANGNYWNLKTGLKTITVESLMNFMKTYNLYK